MLPANPAEPSDISCLLLASRVDEAEVKDLLLRVLLLATAAKVCFLLENTY